MNLTAAGLLWHRIIWAEHIFCAHSAWQVKLVDWQQLRYYIRSLERTDSLLTSTRLDRSNSGDATGNASEDTSTVKRLQPLNGRGLEALKYVDNVRRYYDMLTWMGKQQNHKIEDSLAGIDD